MAIKETIGLSQFRDAFYKMDRKANFSYEGLEVLFNHLEQLSDDTGQDIELDVIALCCEYTESTIAEALDDYNLESLEELEESCIVLRVSGGAESDDIIITENH